jgi:hypothetical protein
MSSALTLFLANALSRRASVSVHGRVIFPSPSARARPSGDVGGAGRATRGGGGDVSWHGSALAISLLFRLRLQPICNCSSLIFLKITCSCLARERTAVSVRFIRMPIALELSPLSANLRSLSSSVCVHGREKRSLCHFHPSLRLASSAAVLKADALGGAAHFKLESNT